MKCFIMSISVYIKNVFCIFSGHTVRCFVSVASDCIIYLTIKVCFHSTHSIDILIQRFSTLHIWLLAACLDILACRFWNLDISLCHNFMVLTHMVSKGLSSPPYKVLSPPYKGLPLPQNFEYLPLNSCCLD